MPPLRRTPGGGGLHLVLIIALTGVAACALIIFGVIYPRMSAQAPAVAEVPLVVQEVAPVVEKASEPVYDSFLDVRALQIAIETKILNEARAELELFVLLYNDRYEGDPRMWPEEVWAEYEHKAARANLALEAIKHECSGFDQHARELARKANAPPAFLQICQQLAAN